MRPSTGFGNEALLVQRILGNTAYDVVKHVSDNMELLEEINNQMLPSAVVYIVEESSLKNVDASKFDMVLTYNKSTSNQIKFWLSDGKEWNEYHQHTQFLQPITKTVEAVGGETSLQVAGSNERVQQVFLNGTRLTQGTHYNTTVYGSIQFITGTLEPKDEVVVDIYSYSSESSDVKVYIHNQETNSGKATGDGLEQTFYFTGVTDVFLNGLRLLHECNQGAYYDSARQALILDAPLSKGDTLVIKYRETI